jgi:ATP-dependent helicase HrpA
MGERREIGAEWERKLSECWPGERGRLRAMVRRMLDGRVGPRPGAVRLSPDAVERELVESAARWVERRALVPTLRYPSELPVAERREEIIAAIRERQVVVVCGETGSGKTTQLPKMCLELGLGVDRMIGHTQPRRIAARAVADRLSEEMQVPTGTMVGAKVRFDDRTAGQTLVKLMTDGILLAETRSDRDLDQYDCLIIDEAHERSLNIDFLLGYLRRVLPRRPDLKVVITSATIDPQSFARHFADARGPAPVIEVSGRTYPVEVRYREEAEKDAGSRDELDAPELAVECLESIVHGAAGDVLIFMPGEREIRQTHKLIRERFAGLAGSGGGGLEVLPLYARLSPTDQQRIFARHTGRRVVISTNVAETSLTVPGIRYVIDSGTARISRYSARTKVQGLPVEAVSRASADQRAGRCGRVGPGVCYRLYTRVDFETRERFTQPEILRTNLASVVLRMADLRLGRPEDFPFIERPDARLIRDGYDTLEELGAIDHRGELTELGKKLARLPIDPRIGRMILAGHAEDCLHDVLVIAAGLSAPDPRDRPSEKQQQADEAHTRFVEAGSDFGAYLKMWDFYHELAGKLSRSKLEKACKESFLSTRRIHEWREIYRQLLKATRDMGMETGHGHAPADRVLRALLTGLVTNVGKKGEGFEYQGCRSTRFAIHPASGLFESRPGWLVAAELVRTSRLYARTCAKIDPAWIEHVAPHLVQKSYASPRWDGKSGRVMADEKVTLLGLEVVARRPVHFGPVDPAQSREIFIHHALVEDELRTGSRAMQHNRALIERVRRLEAKARRNDLLADAQKLFRFYDERLPRDVYSTDSFHDWLRRAEREHPRVLWLREEDLLEKMPEGVTEESFPDHYETLSARLPIDYAFVPGEERDGVTVRVPVELLNQIRPDQADRAIPGLLVEKVGALIRTLPKSLRRNFDAVQTARRLAPVLANADRPLVQDLALELSRLCGVTIRAEDFKVGELDKHLLVRFVVVGTDGREVGNGRDIASLRAEVAPSAAKGQKADASPWSRDDVTDWDFDQIPESLEVRRGAVKMTVFPALHDLGDRAALRVFDTPEAAAESMRRGLARLFVRHLQDEFRFRAQHLFNIEKLRVLYGPLGSARQLEQGLMLAIAERAFLVELPGVRDRAGFAARVTLGWNRIGPAADEIGTLAEQVLALRQSVARRLEDRPPEAWRRAVADMTHQLALLVGPDFLAATPDRWLRCLPRFLRAMEKRVEKLRSVGPARDEELMRQVLTWSKKYDDRRAQHAAQGVHDAALADFRWLIEELRVALFAQDLGTSVKVSGPRMEKAWSEVRV